MVVALWLGCREGDDGDESAGVLCGDGVALGEGGDGDAGVVLKEASIDKSIFSRAKAFAAIGFDAVKGWR
jgi:hypothetical protein